VTFDQFQQNVEPFLWAEIRVKLIIGFVRFLKASEDLNNSIHRINSDTSAAPRCLQPKSGSNAFRHDRARLLTHPIKSFTELIP
jgi:hypothetical protein